MSFDDGQIRELACLYPGVEQAVEGGVAYFLIPALALPDGCTPSSVDALLCPTPRDGYASRLFLASPVSGGPSRNWHVNGVRILERNWHTISWRTRAGLRLAQMVLAHLDAFQKGG